MATRTRRVPFSFREEAEKALAWLIADRRKERARLKKSGETDTKWYARASFFTATDLEQRIRGALQEKLEGRPYGSLGIFGGHGVRVTGGDRWNNLFDRCRQFLLSRSDLESHNFGKGHVSGQRFRPRGWGLTTAEERTLETKTREKPVHIHVRSSYSSVGPACTHVRSEKQRKRGSYGRRTPGFGRGIRTTTDMDKVTCPRCRKLLETPVEVYHEDELVETVTLAQLVARNSWSYEGEDKIRGHFAPNSITRFDLYADKKVEAI